MIDNIFPKLHKEGYKFLAISIIITFIVWIFSNFLATIMILITVWVYYFFRDPIRMDNWRRCAQGGSTIIYNKKQQTKTQTAGADVLISFTEITKCMSTVNLFGRLENLDSRQYFWFVDKAVKAHLLWDLYICCRTTQNDQLGCSWGMANFCS